MAPPSASDAPGNEPDLRPVARPEDAFRDLAREIADLVDDRTRSGGRAVLGLATGRTMVGLYRELARLHREEGLSFGRVVTFNLDEYCGLAPDHPERMAAAMDRELFDHLDQPPEQRHFPDVGEGDLERRCDAYERAIRAAGGLDLQLLGVGRNGHVAFNEPGSSADSRTRRVHLAPATRADAAATFGGLEAVPSAALTVGIATVKEARALRVLAFGAAKAAAVARLVAGPAGDDCPVSLLRGHGDLRLWADDAALGR
ncbi:glucosamine-6-phosphate deaminase [Engelhardtia mirabilis]|uniref:Glucosamine-6-phosphate deaminase 1 n=1 Tax=Engelhardtia mirabilis TaxID=2528011 RepID=A0A518BSU1_9BACT|nr:Glucosamine-6-phosphate deaminase 1 [Planctomycetes bacterium Pla133]QDV04365.1 Glucosamine-6-phosphate deaminase 1 [Planctomycetes bacterium Pla86]